MLIESLIRRKHGTRVTLGSTAYHFRPRITDGPHVAEVEDKAHLQRFMSIPEGFAICEDDTVASPAPVAPADNLAGPVVHTLDSDALDNMSHMEAPTAQTDAEQTGTDTDAPVAPQTDDAQSTPTSTDAPSEQATDPAAPQDDPRSVTDAHIDTLDEDALRVLYKKHNQDRAAPANAKVDTLRDRVKEMVANKA